MTAASGLLAAAPDAAGWVDLVLRAFTLPDYNTRVVVIGTTLLGIAAGVVGTFTYLRKRALMGDALAHATLPGIAVVFIATGAKQLGPLIAGAAVAGILGILCLLGLRRYTRLKEDAAIGVVLSVFFALGLVGLSIVQQMSTGGQAGLQSFIYGKAAAMVRADALLIAATAVGVVLAVAALFKQFRLVCFDQDFAGTQGHPVMLIDLTMMALVIITTVVGLQAVGLIMIIALLIIPAATARFWTDKLSTMVLLAALFGGLSGWIGSNISATLPRMPTGAVIVLCGGALFIASMLLAPRRGIVPSVWRQWALSRRIHRQHLLRAFAELEELAGEAQSCGFAELAPLRSWSAPQLQRELDRAVRRGDLQSPAPERYRLSATGRRQAQRLLRNHRLWEVYLIRYADIAPSHVHRDADEVEHVLSEELIRELEAALESEDRIPSCPHAPEVAGG